MSEKDDITNKLKEELAQLKENGDPKAIFLQEMLDRRTCEGPWSNEPDELNFIDEATGLECLIYRQPEFGNLLGYVIIPEKSIPTFKGIELLDYTLDVHGGVSYSDFDYRRGSGKYYIGFDCAHFGDWSPYMYSAHLSQEIRGTYRDIEFVKAECIKLARQLKDLMEDK